MNPTYVITNHNRRYLSCLQPAARGFVWPFRKSRRVYHRNLATKPNWSSLELKNLPGRHGRSAVYPKGKANYLTTDLTQCFLRVRIVFDAEINAAKRDAINALSVRPALPVEGIL